MNDLLPDMPYGQRMQPFLMCAVCTRGRVEKYFKLFFSDDMKRRPKLSTIFVVEMEIFYLICKKKRPKIVHKNLDLTSLIGKLKVDT